MIPIFRKIRKKMADDNRPLKYMRYAIGEILLVVIGILIALQINNWNEQRKEREKFDQVLVEVEKELIVNIESCRTFINRMFNRDSITSIVLHEDLTYDDYLNNSSLQYNYSYNIPSIDDNVFPILVESNSSTTSEQDSIMFKLKRIQLIKEELTYDFERQGKLFEAHQLEIQEFEWYTDYIMRIKNEERINFLVNNPLHKKRTVIWADHHLYQMGYDIEGFEVESREAYEFLYTYLESKKIPHGDSLLFGYDAENYRHYVGTFKEYEKTNTSNETIEDSTVISIENNKLYYTPYNSVGSNSRREIIPISKYNFRTKRGGGFYRFTFDENGNVTEHIFSSGISRTKFKKIR